MSTASPDQVDTMLAEKLESIASAMVNQLAKKIVTERDRLLDRPELAARSPCVSGVSARWSPAANSLDRCCATSGDRRAGTGRLKC